MVNLAFCPVTPELLTSPIWKYETKLTILMSMQSGEMERRNLSIPSYDFNWITVTLYWAFSDGNNDAPMTSPCSVALKCITRGFTSAGGSVVTDFAVAGVASDGSPRSECREGCWLGSMLSTLSCDLKIPSPISANLRIPVNSLSAVLIHKASEP